MRPYAPGRVIMAGGHPGLWAGIFLLLIVIAVVIGAVVIARTFAHRPAHAVVAPPPPPAPASDGPLRILEERFARGEIDEEEFRRRRDVLRS